MQVPVGLAQDRAQVVPSEADLWLPPALGGRLMATRSEKARPRDVPESCTCHWVWSPGLDRWCMVERELDCPEHFVVEAS